MKGINLISGLIFSLAFVGLVIWLLWGKSCNKGNDLPVTNHVQDSIKHVGDSAASYWQKKAQQLQIDSQRLVRKTDSLTIITNYKDHLLSKSQQSTAQTAGKVIQAKQNNDTTGYENNCNQLVDQVIQQNDIIDSCRKAIKLLLLSKDSLNAVLAVALDTASSTIGLYQKLLASSQDDAKTLFDKYNKETRKNKKRFSLGPSINYGLKADGKLGPIIGLGVTYLILKL